MISYISVLTERSSVPRNAKKYQYTWRLTFGFLVLKTWKVWNLSRYLQKIQNILTCSVVDLYIYQHVQKCIWYFNFNI